MDLANAEEEKLFSAQGYHFIKEIEAYNNSFGGEPQVRFHELSPSVSTTVALTEPGMTSFDGNLYVSLLSRTATDGYIELIKYDHDIEQWEYISTLLNPEDANSLDPQWVSFTATDLFVKDSQPYLLVSPVISVYEGSLLFRVDLENGLVERDQEGLPVVLWRQDKAEGLIQSGVPTYDPGLTATGILIGDVTFDEPQFRMYATGVVPKKVD
jgi:hypothetical protein